MRRSKLNNNQFSHKNAAKTTQHWFHPWRESNDCGYLKTAHRIGGERRTTEFGLALVMQSDAGIGRIRAGFDPAFRQRIHPGSRRNHIGRRLLAERISCATPPSTGMQAPTVRVGFLAHASDAPARRSLHMDAGGLPDPVATRRLQKNIGPGSPFACRARKE
jgi:hypothetical protein